MQILKTWTLEAAPGKDIWKAPGFGQFSATFVTVEYGSGGRLAADDPAFADSVAESIRTHLLADTNVLGEFTVGGRSAVLVAWEGRESVTSGFSGIQAWIPNAGMGWVISLGSTNEAREDSKEIFLEMLDSFEPMDES